MVQNTNKEQRDARELENYNIFRGITNRLFNVPVCIRQTPEKCSHDVRLTAYTTNGEVRYCVELKWQTHGNETLQNYGYLSLKTDKYLYMQSDRREGEREMICYLFNSGEFYIFDADKSIGSKPVNETDRHVIYAKREQYNTNYTPITPQWCFSLYPDDAVCKGRWKG